MNRTVYVNGDYVPENEASVSVFDRGFLFSDGVYEVSAVLKGQLIDNQRHMERLHRSLGELGIPSPATNEQLEAIQYELIRRNNLNEGLVYMQITRGVADRSFDWSEDMQPGLFMFTQAKPLIDNDQARNGISVITTPDIRWKRRDIKTVGLLAPSMAKMQAKAAGADDAWMVDDAGLVTEGTSNNAFIITPQGSIVTRALSNDILHGITRRAVLALADENSMTVEERSFTAEEAESATEAFVTSAATFVWPVITINGRDIGDGRPGPLAKRLRELYIDMALDSGKD